MKSTTKLKTRVAQGEEGETLVIKVVTQCVFSLPLHTSKEMMCGVDSTIFFKLKGKYDFILSNIERMFNLRLKLL